MSKINDKIINRVIEKIQKRAEAGYKKYGVGLDKDEQSLGTWLNHLQEELMDATLYLEKLKQIQEGIEKIKQSDTGCNIN